MDILMLCLIPVAFFAIVGLFVWMDKRQKRKAHDAEIKAASEVASKRKMVETYPASQGPWVGSGGSSSGTLGRSSSYAPGGVTHVHHDSGMNPLMAGAIGYMLASSGGGHAHAAQGQEASCKPESSSDSNSSYDSGSSSSYDSGSSSSYDSGSSGGGSFD